MSAYRVVIQTQRNGDDRWIVGWGTGTMREVSGGTCPWDCDGPILVTVSQRRRQLTVVKAEIKNTAHSALLAAVVAQATRELDRIMASGCRCKAPKPTTIDMAGDVRELREAWGLIKPNSAAATKAAPAAGERRAKAPKSDPSPPDESAEKARLRRRLSAGGGRGPLPLEVRQAVSTAVRVAVRAAPEGADVQQVAADARAKALADLGHAA